MGLLKKLIVTGAFATAAACIYSVATDKPAQPKPEAIIQETDALLKDLGLVDTNFSRFVPDENGDIRQFCVDAKKPGNDTELEACFKINNGGHVKLAGLTRK
ncbi:MAG: hypothetical protein PW788_11250 [Micavibrio sp.]|nr:hypothetical protein [Micavibrio sp.]